MTTRFFFPLFAVLFFQTGPALATIKIDSIRGVSNYDIVNSPFQIMGGTGGDLSTECTLPSSSLDGCSTCDNTLHGCNMNRIYPTRLVSITFSSDSINDNTVYRATARVTSSSSSDIPGIPVCTVNAKNTNCSVEFLWRDLCSTLITSSTGGTFTAATDCEDGNLTGSITIGFVDNSTTTGAALADSVEVKVRIDTPNPLMDPARDVVDDCATAAVTTGQQGICHFEVYPGDEKAYVDNLKPVGVFPTSGVFRTKYLRFFYSTTGFADVTPRSSYKDIELDTSTSAGNAVETLANKLGGLTNDQIYFFRVATVDEGMNVADFTSDAAINAVAGCTVPDVSSCPFMVQPSAVLGLLPKDFNCFITSAAYGSPMEKHVQLFKQFRGDILMKSEFGRAIARVYYKYGPYPALFLMRHPVLKPFARAALWPAWGVAWVSLNYGVWAGLLVSLLPLMAGILTYRISRKKSHAQTVTTA